MQRGSIAQRMSFGFRICFKLPGGGSLGSDEESISFTVDHTGQSLKLSSGTRGPIGKTDRFILSGGSFDTAESARLAAEQVRLALLLWATRMRQGIDLGQHSLKGFIIHNEGKQHLADLLEVSAVQADYLGITIFRDDPPPTFVRSDSTTQFITPAQKLVDELSESIGRREFVSTKAEVAAGIYATSRCVGSVPACFLLLFVSLETLLVRKKSIKQTGRDFAAKHLNGETYESMTPADFFSHIYRIRNNMVHHGQIDTAALQSILGETGRFVADLLQRHVHTSPS